MKKKLLQKTLTIATLSSALICTACGPSPSPSTVPSQSPQASASPSPEASASPEATITPEPVETVTPEPEEPVYALKDKTKLKDWEITVKKIEFVDSVKKSEYSGFMPAEGNKYLLISITATNNGTEEDSIFPSYIFNNDVYAKVYDGEENEYSITHLIGYDKTLVDVKIDPSSTKKGKIAFEVPAALEDTKEDLLLKIMSESESVTYKLNK